MFFHMHLQISKSKSWGLENFSFNLDNITTSAGYRQLINEPTYFVNKTYSCIVITVSSDLNITRNCGIEKRFHEKCHHSIIYGTLNFNVPLPPPYYREIWDHKYANTENIQIQNSISTFDWQKAFKNKNINEMTNWYFKVVCVVFLWTDFIIIW